MKKSHILGILAIAAAIAIIATSAADTSSYVTFAEAYTLASNGSKRDIHVVGELTKDGEGNVTGLMPGADKVSFSFSMIDDSGKEQRVYYNQPMPPDFTRSEKVVVVGHYSGETFIAEKILLKCPSKYQEETKLNVES